ncbi:ABC transporter permease [Companilactobacillus mishanensis]|uniref:ABC transporter permease n=1 Tax=Companilactobacillus mishanensis TaxID=2486008 RepID=A0ABW9P7K7_9LACO|nr:ABC transporter permease [Companilactobacillus mishanensis]MQS45047.1 ABC transporter permease [Companilactobacillus mishanensis]
MNKMWIVTAQTYLRQVKSWSFILLILTPFIFGGIGMGIGSISANSADQEDRIAVVSSEASLRDGYIKQNKDDVAKKYTTVDASKKALKSKDIAGYLVLSNSDKQVKATFHGNDDLDSGTKSRVQIYLSQVQQQFNLQNAKLTGAQAAALQTQPQFKQDIQKNVGKQNIAMLISFWVMVVMVYIILITYSSITAQEIASEKGTKIMEIIFSSTSAVKYFVGKILGVLLVIVTQILVYVLGGWIVLNYAKSASLTKDFFADNQTMINSVIHNLFGVNMLFLLLGVVLFTILSALSGALVSKAEDASKAAQPSIMLAMLTFFSTFPFQNNPESIFAKILSYVPFFSSYFMPLRVINHAASPLEIGLSLLILLVTIGLMGYYIGRMYKGLMLQTDTHGFWSSLKSGLAYNK